MPRTFTLAAVLALRQQKEEAEERALAAISAQVQQIRSALERVAQETTRHAQERAREVHSLLAAAHHQASHAQLLLLRRAQAEWNEQLDAAERLRHEQQARYVEARSQREMLSELQQQQRAAWEDELSDREQKRLDDQFASRRLRHEN